MDTARRGISGRTGRSSRRIARLARAGFALLGSALLAPSAGAQGDPDELQITGYVQALYAHGFEETNLRGGSLNDGNGIQATVGFELGSWFAFDGTYEWLKSSDADTHFVAFGRGFFLAIDDTPLRLFALAGMGPFFSRLDGFPKESNARAFAWRAGAGADFKISEHIYGVTTATYNKGFGSADDYEWASLTAGVMYRF